MAGTLASSWPYFTARVCAAWGSPELSSGVPDLSHVGPYELVRPLGAGGMAQTFAAVRRGPAGFEQRVCLKRILPNHAEDRLFVEQFLDEARLLAHLRHGGIVQVYDFGEIDGSYFMALELVEGSDLDRLLVSLSAKSQRLPLPVSLHITAQVLSALHYAHGAELDGEPLHIVHRDISPGNILLSRQGEVKVADFGIAKSRHRVHKTQAGFTKGKIAYMSPEQVRGEELDLRSDLFAVGVVLHELVTGVHPFDAATDITTLSNILSGTRPPLRSLVPELRADVAALVNALLATDRDMRPASAADALRLIPPREKPFVTERRLAEIVQAHAPSPGANAARPSAHPAAPGAANPGAGGRAKAEHEARSHRDAQAKTTANVGAEPAHASAPAGVPHVPWDAATVPLPSAAPFSGADARQVPGALESSTDAPTFSALATGYRPHTTDEYGALVRPRRASASTWLLSFAALVLAAGAWLAYRYVHAGVSDPHREGSASRAAEESRPAREAQSERPAAALPASPSEEEDEPADEPERAAATKDLEPERAPVILHAPDTDALRGARAPAPAGRESRKFKRLPRSAAAARSPAPPTAPREETPVQDTPAAEPRPRHRTGSSLSTDQF